MAFLLKPEQQAMTYDKGYFYPGPAVKDVPQPVQPAASAQEVKQNPGAAAALEVFGATSTFRGRPGLRSQRCANAPIASFSQSLPVLSSYIGTGKPA